MEGKVEEQMRGRPAADAVVVAADVALAVAVLQPAVTPLERATATIGKHQNKTPKCCKLVREMGAVHHLEHDVRGDLSTLYDCDAALRRRGWRKGVEVGSVGVSVSVRTMGLAVRSIDIEWRA
jgi:hypothetical protein